MVLDKIHLLCFNYKFYIIMCDVATCIEMYSYGRKKVVFQLAFMLSHYFTYWLSLRNMYELKYYLVFQRHYSTIHQMLILWKLSSVAGTCLSFYHLRIVHSHNSISMYSVSRIEVMIFNKQLFLRPIKTYTNIKSTSEINQLSGIYGKLSLL